jgi:hypothetical protein
VTRLRSRCDDHATVHDLLAAVTGTGSPLHCHNVSGVLTARSDSDVTCDVDTNAASSVLVTDPSSTLDPRPHDP